MASVGLVCGLPFYVHRSSWVYEGLDSIRFCPGIMATRVTYGALVRPPLSNNDAACCDSSSTLMKHRSQKGPAFMFAPSWCEK